MILHGNTKILLWNEKYAKIEDLIGKSITPHVISLRQTFGVRSPRPLKIKVELYHINEKDTGRIIKINENIKLASLGELHILRDNSRHLNLNDLQEDIDGVKINFLINKTRIQTVGSIYNGILEGNYYKIDIESSHSQEDRLTIIVNNGLVIPLFKDETIVPDEWRLTKKKVNQSIVCLCGTETNKGYMIIKDRDIKLICKDCKPLFKSKSKFEMKMCLVCNKTFFNKGNEWCTKCAGPTIIRDGKKVSLRFLLTYHFEEALKLYHNTNNKEIKRWLEDKISPFNKRRSMSKSSTDSILMDKL